MDPRRIARTFSRVAQIYYNALKLTRYTFQWAFFRYDADLNSSVTITCKWSRLTRYLYVPMIIALLFLCLTLTDMNLNDIFSLNLHFSLSFIHISIRFVFIIYKAKLIHNNLLYCICIIFISMQNF